MSLVSITEAAELVDKSTQTLYRHIKSGKISRESNGQLQTAELIRVYGELKQHEKPNKLASNDNFQSHSDNVVTLLQQQINRLEKDLQDLKTESLEREKQAIEREERAAEREKRLMTLLENQSSRENSVGLFGKLFKS